MAENHGPGWYRAAVDAGVNRFVVFVERRSQEGSRHKADDIRIALVAAVLGIKPGTRVGLSRLMSELDASGEYDGDRSVKDVIRALARGADDGYPDSAMLFDWQQAAE